ncbi:MAG: InlB B-repeat-containing protein, partial [archaeon]|nr:InlB B-repeat-containing protein [archaeon]
ATYTFDYVLYTITFVLDNGQPNVVKDKYHYGDKIEVPADPVKPATDKYVYKFTKWTPVLDETVVADKTFTANYSCTISEKVEASAGFTLDAATKSLLASADKLSVTFVDGSSLVAYIVFDKTAATALVEGETLTVKKLDISAVDPAVQDQLKGATIWDIDFGANNSVFSSGKANVNLHYKRGAADYVGLDFYFVNGDKLDKLTYTYDTENDCIVFDTTHFSTYAAQNSLSNVNWSEYYPVFIIIAVALALFVVIYRFS